MLFRDRIINLPVDVIITPSIGLKDAHVGFPILPNTQDEIDRFFIHYPYDESLLIPENPDSYTEAELEVYRLDKMIEQVSPLHLFQLSTFLFESLSYLGSFLNDNFKGYHVLYMSGYYLSLSTLNFLSNDMLETIEDLVVVSSFNYVKTDPSSHWSNEEQKMVWNMPTVEFFVDISMHCRYAGKYSDVHLDIPFFTEEQLMTFPSGFKDALFRLKEEGIWKDNFRFTMYLNRFPFVKNFHHFRGFYFNHSYSIKHTFSPSFPPDYQTHYVSRDYTEMQYINFFDPRRYYLLLPVAHHNDVLTDIDPVTGERYPVHVSRTYATEFRLYRIYFKGYDDDDDSLDGVLGSLTPIRECCLAECFGITV